MTTPFSPSVFHPRPTIHTVAAAAGVSICTVNKALTGKPRISEKTRQHVIETAKRLGYRRNNLASILSRPMRTLGVVFPTIWPSHYDLLLEGIRTRLHELSDYHLRASFSMASPDNDYADFLKIIQQMIADKVDGLILSLGYCTSVRRHEILNLLQKNPIPHILFESQKCTPEKQFPNLALITPGSKLCGHWAAELLELLLSPEYPVVILLGERQLEEHEEKYQSFRNWLCKDRKLLLIEHHDIEEEALHKCRELLKKHPDIGGLYIATENANGVFQALSEFALERKVRVIATGVSAEVLKRVEDGRVLATLSQQEPQQGGLAVDLLFQLLENGIRPERKNTIEPQLIMRPNLKSC